MPISTTEFNFIRNLVRERSAIVLEPGKEYLVESRLASVARGEGYACLEHFLAELRSKPTQRMHRQVVEAMTTNETSFFRDVHPFDALRQAVVPELLQRRAAERRLTIWCAACSSGQEPYSIAMTLRDHCPGLAGWTVRIVATDLSAEMLERGRRGRYGQVEMNRGLPAPMLVKHFKKDGLEWEISDELRRMVEFRELNLAESWPALPAPDVVFLRNVLIYFDVETKRSILSRVRRLMRPDGYLFLGGAETTMNLDDAFQRVQVGKAVCYRPGHQ
jgi:chemotaxis protein methyltransferase CheR